MPAFRRVLILIFLMLFAASAFARDELIETAEKLYRSGRVPEAKRMIANFITNNETAKGYVEIGHLYSRMRKWPEAVHYLSIATTREPKDAQIWYELGLAQHQNKNVDESIESIRRSISLNPKKSHSVFALGEILEYAHDRYEARQIYIAAIKKLGNQAAIRAKLCWVNYQDSFFAETIRQCSKAVELNPKDDVSWGLLGKTYFDSQVRDKAFKTFKKGLSLNPNSAPIHRARGLVYFEEKSWEQAAVDLGKAFGIDPLDDEAGVYLARALFETGSYEHALPIFSEACRLNRSYRFDFLAKQRDLMRKNLDEIASRYQEVLDTL
ncbi:MAG: tetratricopeptide repeat protein [Oligoflexia bacterium]|nr:tetratricopeptide repeat protein [Oligoflexia bacterium]